MTPLRALVCRLIGAELCTCSTPRILLERLAGNHETADGRSCCTAHPAKEQRVCGCACTDGFASELRPLGSRGLWILPHTHTDTPIADTMGKYGCSLLMTYHVFPSVLLPAFSASR
jgi:hypothetical protein